MAKKKVKKKSNKPRLRLPLTKEEAFLVKAKFIRDLDVLWEHINTECLEEFFRNYEGLVKLMDDHYAKMTKPLIKELEAISWTINEDSETFEDNLAALGQKVIDCIKAIGSGDENDNLRKHIVETITKSTLDVMEKNIAKLIISTTGLPVKNEFLKFYDRKKTAMYNMCEDFIKYVSCEVGDLYVGYSHKLINALNSYLDGMAIFVFEAKQERSGTVSVVLSYKYNKESVVLVDDIKEDFEELKYISDYKELNKVAETKGYSFVRCSGDHGIFKNDDGKIVVIPQGRSIGKGLSIKIQKDLIYSGGIYERCTC